MTLNVIFMKVGYENIQNNAGEFTLIEVTFSRSSTAHRTSTYPAHKAGFVVYSP